MARNITKQVQNYDGSVSVLIMDPKVERLIVESIQATPQGMTYLSLDPAVADRIAERIRKSFEEGMARGYQPVLLCSQTIRRFVKRLTDRISNSIMVISNSEIAPNTKILSLGTIRLD
jgi:flagellar biosynthesis protein FlhA